VTVHWKRENKSLCILTWQST